MSYKVKHLGDGNFIATMNDGTTKEVGPNLIGMIRYTFFEDFTLPPVDWEITKDELFKEYYPKVGKDIFMGKIKYGQHNFGDTDWIK